MSLFETDEKNQVWKIVKELNGSWAEGEPRKVGEFFHENMTVYHPDMPTPISGREACVDSYVQFCDRATVLGYEILDPEIEIFGNTAVAVYHYRVSYDMNDKVYDDSGRDVFVFTRDGDKWLIVWRTMFEERADDEQAEGEEEADDS